MRLQKIDQPGFLIDLDGLLINSEELSKIAFERMCKDLGCGFTDDYHSSIRGKRKLQWSTEFVDNFMLSVDAAEVIKRHSEFLLEELDRSVQLMPGAEALLAWINERNYPTALVTSSDRTYAETYTSRLGISRFFQTMVTEEDVENGKPDPEPYFVGAERIQRDPVSCFVLEDSVNGVLSGKAAGSVVIAVPSVGVRSASLEFADYIVASLVEALCIVRNMGL